MNMGYVAKTEWRRTNDEAMRREAMAADRVRSQLSEIKQAAGEDKNRLVLVADLAQGAEELIKTLAVTREEYKLGARRWRKINSRYDKSIRGSIAYLLNSADKMVATEEVKKTRNRGENSRRLESTQLISHHRSCPQHYPCFCSGSRLCTSNTFAAQTLECKLPAHFKEGRFIARFKQQRSTFQNWTSCST